MDNREINKTGSEATGNLQPQVTPLPQRPVASPPPETPKIQSVNANGTKVWTSKPNNEAELQLYRVMQRASLLAYYDTLLEMGGDDVQQLGDASSEEFLEIMALVGMAQKPLHVRRFQKALQEWVNNPSLFQTPLDSPTNSNSFSGIPNVRPPTTTAVLSPVVTIPSIVPTNSHISPVGVKEVPTARSPGHNQQVIYFDSNNQRESTSRGPSPGPCLGRQSPGSPLQLTPVLVTSEMISALALEAEEFIKKLINQKRKELKYKMIKELKDREMKDKKLEDQKIKEVQELIDREFKKMEIFPLKARKVSREIRPDIEVYRIIEFSEDKIKELINLELDTMEILTYNLTKVPKEFRGDLEKVINMAEDFPRRMDEVRKFAAIYNRFNQRKSQKPLTQHEAVVNEMSAQLCKLAPALLTRRDETFRFAREILKQSGFQCLKGQTSFPPLHRADSYQMSGRNGDENHTTKRAKIDSSSNFCDNGQIDRTDKIRRQERLEQIAEELRKINDRSEEIFQSAPSLRPTTSLQQQIDAMQKKKNELLLERNDLLNQPQPARSYRCNSSRMSISNYNDSEKNDTDDTDSQFSLSNASSPSQEVGDSRDSLLRDGENFNSNSNGPFSVKSPGKNSKQSVTDVSSDEGVRNQSENDYDNFFQDNKVQVISSSGGNIIAVANPALSMSSMILKEEDDDLIVRETPLSLKIERQTPKLINHKPD